MDEIQHSYLHINGLSLHVAHIGTGDTLSYFCTGFHRYGTHGGTKWSLLLKPVIVQLHRILEGMDSLAILHPKRVFSVVTLGVPYVSKALITQLYGALPEGYYIMRWRTPGRAEADFGRFDVKTVIKKVYILFAKSDTPVAEENQEVMDLAESSDPLPSWFTEEDLSNYATLYEKSGFRTPLTVPYRALPTDFGEIVVNVSVPALLIMGGSDYFIKFPGMEEYVTSGMVKQFVPNLEVKFVDNGSHFVQEQFPEQVNQHIISFLRNNA